MLKTPPNVRLATAASPRPVRGSAPAAANRTIAAGVIDAALSSLATFICGLVAARTLELTTLGGYALVFATTQLATMTADTSTFAMLEVMAVRYPAGDRLRLLASTLRLGALPTAVPALAVALWVLFTPAGLPHATILALTITGVAYAFLSPIQDHYRRMMHVCDASWIAAGVSALHLVVVGASALALLRLRVGVAWIPFGALAAGNAVSLAVGMGVARHRARGGMIRLPVRWSEVFRSGRWLVLSGVAPNAAALVASALVGHLDGMAALGYSEVARVAGQPLAVLSLGLSATIGPRIVAAVQQHRPADASRASRTFVALVIVSGIAYLGVSGESWPWNPVLWVLPRAYVLTGLMSLTVVANIVAAAAYPARSELLGADNTRALAHTELVGNTFRILIACAAPVLGAFAIPLGVLVLGAARVLGYGAAARRYWSTVAAARRDGLRPIRHKDFPPGWGHIKIPISSRDDALASLSLFPACRPNAVRAQQAASVAIRLFGPRVLPGPPITWIPVDGAAWPELVSLWRKEVGPFDAVAGYERYQPDRGGAAVLLLSRGRAIAFVKLRQGDGRALENERLALETVWRARPPSFGVPEPLAWGAVLDWHYFAMGTVPHGLHRMPANPPLGAIVRDITEGLSGFRRPAETPACWQAMHGDLTPWNLREISDSLFLFDWERAGWGPPGADEVLYLAAKSALDGTRSDLRPDALEAICYWEQRMQSHHARRRDGRLNASLRRVLRDMRARAERTGAVAI